MKTRWHLLALAAIAFVVGLLFLQVPGFGDDLTYWSFGFELHERGLAAWQRASFHDLRWPVWGVCWLLQSLFGIGLASYYGEPLLYLMAGALLGFAFGKKLTGSIAVGWACGIAFLFDPLLDTVSYRPMPDLSEGVWGAAIMLAWWTAMTAEKRGQILLTSVLAGVGVFIIEANRVTGVFIVPVLILCTLMFFPRRFGWLLLAGAVAAVLYVGECYFYHRLFHDWLHDLNANIGNKGAKGTDFPSPWELPFRFLDTLWKDNRLAPIYCVSAAAGLWFAWRRFGVLGRVLVVWLAALYFLYSCAPQSLVPYRPLVRDADRFMCALVVPMSLFAVLGIRALVTLPICFRGRRFELTSLPGPAVLVVSVIALTIATSREHFDMGFVPGLRRYLAELPTGTKIFSHKSMREIVFLVDSKAARRFAWTAPGEIMNRSEKLEAQAAACTEFWYARKLLWLNTRKALEKRSMVKQPPLGSYLDAPEHDWVLTRLFAKGDTPDLIFYRRRTADSPPAQVLGPDAPEWQQLIPNLPTTLTRDHPLAHAEWKIPAELKGRLARFEFEAACAQVEGLSARLRFAETSSGKPKAEYLLKPYLYRDGGKEFFALQIPDDAPLAVLNLKLGKKATEVAFSGFRAVIERAAPPQRP